MIRILKISKFFPGLNLVLTSLIYSGPMIIRLIIFAGSFMLCMSFIPFKYLKGKMHRCVNVDDDYAGFVETKFDCYDFGGDWIQYDFGFDNILKSIYNLYVVATSEGWSWYMTDTWDSYKVDY